MITYSVINLNWQKVKNFYSKMHHLINLELFLLMYYVSPKIQSQKPKSQPRGPNLSLKAQILAWRPTS